MYEVGSTTFFTVNVTVKCFEMGACTNFKINFRILDLIAIHIINMAEVVTEKLV